MHMYSGEIIEQARKIGDYYFQKNEGNYDATKAEILNLEIQDIDVDGDVIKIHTSRPGILIGKRGQNIDALEAHLSKKIKIIEENNINYFIFPGRCTLR